MAKGKLRMSKMEEALNFSDILKKDQQSLRAEE